MTAPNTGSVLKTPEENLNPHELHVVNADIPSQTADIPNDNPVIEPEELPSIQSISDALKIAHEAIAVADRKDDPDAGAVFADIAIAAFKYTYDNSKVEWARLRQKLKQCRAVKLSDIEDAIFGNDETALSENVNDVELLISIASESSKFYHDADRKTYASYPMGNKIHFCMLGSQEFNDYMTCKFLELENRAPNPKALQTALNTLSARAKFKGELVAVFLRVAKVNDEYWIDLCNDLRQAVCITPKTWNVVDNPPIKFIRSSTMRALPTPVKGTGNLDALWNVTNFQKKDRLLVLVWSIEALRPDTPYPIMAVTGEQGSAKSSSHSKLRDMIDPNKINLRAAANKRDDLIVGTVSNHVQSYENLSSLTPEVQDLFCSMATGSGFAKRQWYSDSDEVTLDIKKPVMLNSIPNVLTAQDAIDRVVNIQCLPLAKKQSEVTLNEYWQKHYPAAFTGLLDAFVDALAHLPEVSLEGEEPSRLIDFTLLGEAVYLAHGLPAKSFLNEFRVRRQQNINNTIEESPVAVAMLNYLKANEDGFEGTVGLLATALIPFYADDEKPLTAKSLGLTIQRLKPALRQLGAVLEKEGKRESNGFPCSLKRDSSIFQA